jgi:hypothetical protein
MKTKYIQMVAKVYSAGTVGTVKKAFPPDADETIMFKHPAGDNEIVTVNAYDGLVFIDNQKQFERSGLHLFTLKYLSKKSGIRYYLKSKPRPLAGVVNDDHVSNLMFYVLQPENFVIKVDEAYNMYDHTGAGIHIDKAIYDYDEAKKLVSEYFHERMRVDSFYHLSEVIDKLTKADKAKK